MRTAAAFVTSLLLFIHASCATADVLSSIGPRLTLQESLNSAVRESAVFVQLSSLKQQYHDLGKDRICLTTTKSCGYPIFRSKLTCASQCPSEGPYEHTFSKDDVFLPGLQDPYVGRCQLSILSSESKFTRINKNTQSLGSYQLKCVLNSQASTCGPDGCGDLVLTGTGEAYLAFKAVLEGPRVQGEAPILAPGGIPEVRPCYIARELNITRSSPIFDNSTGPGKQAEAALKKFLASTDSIIKGNSTVAGGSMETSASRGDETVTFAQGLYVFSGPVSISSKTHATKWKEGWVDYKFALSITQISRDELAANERIAGYAFPRVDSRDLNTYQFQLYRATAHY